MTKKGLKENIYDFYSNILLAYGYKPDKGHDCFKKRTGLGCCYIAFGIVDYNPEQRISFSVSVRHNQVEKICNRYLETRPNWASNSITLMENINGPGQKKSGKHLFYSVTNMDDMHQMLIEVLPEIKTKGFEFLDKYSSLDEVERKINDIDRHNRIFFSNHFAFRSLVVAKLCNRKNFEELVTYYQAEFERLPDKFLYPDKFYA